MSDTINAESRRKGGGEKAKELERLSTGDELLKMKGRPGTVVVCGTGLTSYMPHGSVLWCYFGRVEGTFVSSGSRTK